MKGILKKTEQGWVVRYPAYIPPHEYELSIHPDSMDFGILLDDTEVEFEIIGVDRGSGISQAFAKIINQELPKKNDVRELEVHELEVLRNKIKREIGEREPISKYGSGYKQALIDVEGMIMDMLVVPCFPKQNDVREDDVEKEQTTIELLEEELQKLEVKYINMILEYRKEKRLIFERYKLKF